MPRVESELEIARKKARDDGLEATVAWVVAAVTILPNLLDGEVVEAAEVAGALALTARWLFAEFHYQSLQRRSPAFSPRLAFSSRR